MTNRTPSVHTVDACETPLALAAPRLSVDDLVLLGSPGARARTVRELHTAARVWAARTEGDWTRLIPHIQIGDLGHGTDPTSPAFGARPLPVGGTSGHDGYFRPGSAALAGPAGVADGAIPGALPWLRTRFPARYGLVGAVTAAAPCLWLPWVLPPPPVVQAAVMVLLAVQGHAAAALLRGFWRRLRCRPDISHPGAPSPGKSAPS